jgi:pyruvate,orthophosphate dikinase
MKVRTNAETPPIAAPRARVRRGGIGLCRTEHMFFDAEAHHRRAPDDPGRTTRPDGALRWPSCCPNSAATSPRFSRSWRPAGDDPPARSAAARIPAARRRRIRRASRAIGIGVETLKRRAAELHEFNPMLGHRGCRLGVTFPKSTKCRPRHF